MTSSQQGQGVDKCTPCLVPRHRRDRIEPAVETLSSRCSILGVQKP